MRAEVEVYTLHGAGFSFVEIAQKIGLQPKEVGLLWTKAETARSKFKAKEKVVYRKRLINKKVKK